MDFFQHRYYKTTKILMSIIGQWPDQTIPASRGSLAIVIFLSSSLYVAVTMAAIKYHGDWEILLDCISAIVGGVFCFIRLIIFVCNSEKTLKLLNRIRADWFVWAEYREVNILHDYADEGSKYVIVYAVGMYALILLFVIQPILPRIIDVVLNNGSEPGVFPIPVYYYHLDAQKYYFYLIIHIYLCASALMTLHITNDVVLIVYMQHGCGIFAALGHKVELIGKNVKSGETKEPAYVLEQRNRTLESQIFWCIARHNDAIEKSEPQDTLRFVATAACLIAYVYVESYFAHVLTDHSISIRYYIQNSQWYNLSTKVQKLLLMMTMRCNAPCRLTVGKMFNISVETFAGFLKTAMSYLTVLCSM